MSHLVLDVSNALSFSEYGELDDFQSAIDCIHKRLNSRTEQQENLLGWLNHPLTYDVDEFKHIQRAAITVQQGSEILLVIGIGGSYTGTRAAIEMLTHHFNNHLLRESRRFPQLFFVGNQLSSTYISDLIELLRDKDFSINIVSKSGRTLEPAIAFRIFRKILEEKYGKHGARSRIVVTTDRQEGRLIEMAMNEGYETFFIPPDIGGRFSVLTAVGLFPLAVSGIRIEELMEGAVVARTELSQRDIKHNNAYKYAVTRNVLYQGNKNIELFVSYEPNFHYFLEWWKQLFAESEGKSQKGIFPSTAIYSTDLHSLGQYVQEGPPNLFETILRVRKTNKDIRIERTNSNQDELNYLAGQTVDFVNNKIFEGTLQAHAENGIPNIVIEVPEVNAFTVGYLFYFFQLSCAVSGYLLGVNPFNQPGVEVYKEKVQTLLKQTTIKAR